MERLAPYFPLALALLNVLLWVFTDSWNSWAMAVVVLLASIAFSLILLTQLLLAAARDLVRLTR